MDLCRTTNSKVSSSRLATLGDLFCKDMYFVYIIECGDTSLYTGITTDVERRLKQHASGKGGRYTSAKESMRIAYTEEHPDRSSALKREAEIKKWRRDKKLALIETRHRGD